MHAMRWARLLREIYTGKKILALYRKSVGSEGYIYINGIRQNVEALRRARRNSDRAPPRYERGFNTPTPVIRARPPPPAMPTLRARAHAGITVHAASKAVPPGRQRRQLSSPPPRRATVCYRTARTPPRSAAVQHAVLSFISAAVTPNHHAVTRAYAILRFLFTRA